MITANTVAEAENAFRNENANKKTPSDRRVFRMKANALNDVQNTLHSRPVQLGKAANTGMKAPSKPSSQSSGCKNILPTNKIITAKKTKATSTNTWKELHSTPNIHSGHLEYHNHILCEQAEQSSVNDFLVSYKLSDSQINALTKSVKNFVAPFTYKVTEPCKDIEIPLITKSENIFSVTDVFNDLLPVQIEAPAW